MPREPRIYDNPGRAPSKWPADTEIGVEFACGHVSKWTFTRSQLRWDLRGEPFDIARFWRA